MDLKEKITAKLAEIKKVVFEDEVAEEKTFVDAKTATGEILKVEPALEVGATVMVITEDGEEAPAPDGAYELEDGSVIAIEAGVIANVEAIEAPAEEEMAAEPVAEAVEETPKAPFDLEALQGQIIDKLNVAITEKIEKLRFAKTEEVEKLIAENDKLKAGFNSALELIEELASVEAVEPETKVKPNAFKKKRAGRLTIQELKELTK